MSKTLARCFDCEELKVLGEFTRKERQKKKKRVCHSCRKMKKVKEALREEVMIYIFTRYQKSKPVKDNLNVDEKQKKNARKATSKIKSVILERDKYTCHYCGECGDTIDHKKPISKGGATTKDNCVCSCKFCNSIKQSMDYSDFEECLQCFTKEEWLNLRHKWI